MAISGINSGKEPSTRRCDCYKVASLAETILGANQTSDLKDRYDLGEQLGWGQFGVIRACHDKFTGEVLACKSIAKDRLVTNDDMRSIKLEIEIMTRLSGHPNVVDLKAVYEEEDYVHLVMELCAGGELFHQLEKHGRFSEAEARILFRHLMQVVLYCHENGVVHRDLKPENILLATKTSSSEIKLADFGLATYVNPGQSLHGTVGSPFYIAPEVLAGGYDQAADVWSAGVILYILLSTMPPFWGKTKSRIFDAVRAADLRFPSNPWDHISESAKDLIRRMLCTDPRQRLTAEQVLDHSWMKDDSLYSEPNESRKQSCGVLEFGGGSFSSFMLRNQDISFGIESPTNSDAQSPALTCSSSFSPHLGFAFHGEGDSDAMEFSSPMPSMPSFSFFSPDSTAKQGRCSLELSTNISTIDNIHKEASLGKLLVLPESSLDLHVAREVKRSEGTNMSRIFHNKRNRTIGLGEREPFDLLVTESVIRWSSCTHLPTPISSLVC